MNFELKIFWNTLELCFPVANGCFQRKLTQNFYNMEVRIENLKSKSRKYTIFQTNQYGE